MKNLFPQYAMYWRKIGLSLGILEPVLDNIDADHPYVKEKFHGVLMRWVEIYPNATWRAIITVVDHLEDAHRKIFLYMFTCIYVQLYVPTLMIQEQLNVYLLKFTVYPLNYFY